MAVGTPNTSQAANLGFQARLVLATAKLRATLAQLSASMWFWFDVS